MHLVPALEVLWFVQTACRTFCQNVCFWRFLIRPVLAWFCVLCTYTNEIHVFYLQEVPWKRCLPTKILKNTFPSTCKITQFRIENQADYLNNIKQVYSDFISCSFFTRQNLSFNVRISTHVCTPHFFTERTIVTM